MDKIVVEGLAVETVIGVLDWERQIQQRLLIDLELGVDIRPAASKDDLNQTLDYAAISDAVVAFTEESSYQLIETLAENLAALIIREFSVPSIKIKISKPSAVPAAKNVAVVIKRGQC